MSVSVYFNLYYFVGKNPSENGTEKKSTGLFIQERRPPPQFPRLEKRSLSDSLEIHPGDPNKRKRLTRIRFIKVKEIHPDAPEPRVIRGDARGSFKSKHEQRKNKTKNRKSGASNVMSKGI